MNTRRFWCTVFIVSGLLWATPASGQPVVAGAGDPGDAGDASDAVDASDAADDKAMESSSGGTKPWEQGVTEQDKDAARELFREGNKLLKQSLFVKAMEKYRLALSHWQHPGIHFNLALALVQQDKLLEAHASLTKALEYEDGLDRVKRSQAQRELDGILRQLAWLEVECDEEGAKVTVDGQQKFIAPGKWEGFVREGKHSIVATKEGFINANKAIDLDGGARQSLTLELFTADDVTEYRRRWALWKPWSVFGAGVVVAMVGGGLHYSSTQNFAEFDRLIRECEIRLGAQCNAAQDEPEALVVRDRAGLQQGLAIAMYAVGGAAIVGGLVLVYANRLKPHRLDVEESDAAGVVVVPLIGPDIAGVSAGFQF